MRFHEKYFIKSLIFKIFFLLGLVKACPKQAQSVPVRFDYEGLNGLCLNPSLREGLNLALRDIELALATSKYPEEKAFKLYERQGECYAALGNADLAMESYQMAMKMIRKNSRLPKDKLKNFILGIQKKLENLKAEQSKSNGVVTKK